MAQTTSFPAEFTSMGIVQMNSAVFTIPGTDYMQAFVETGSFDFFVMASLLDASNFSDIRLVSARMAADTSGDNGILVTIHLSQSATPNPPINCVVCLLQKGATRYQDPRKY
jgi:hypothetical protein